jgi:hypothetical protein
MKLHTSADQSSLPETPVRTSKAMYWTGWVLTILPVLMMGGLGTVFFFMPKAAEEGMAKYGYPTQSTRVILAVEVLCALIYVIPRTAVLGAILLTGYLGGATATHVRAGEPFIMPIIVGVVVWLGIFLRDARLRALVPLRRL